MRKNMICRLLMTVYVGICALNAMAQEWPAATREAKPGTRWWWLGSAVDMENLRWNLQQYASHGIGAVEITPLYGVQGNGENNIPYLSDRWMHMLRETQALGRENDIEIGMATGTGWPFGGPWVPLKESACKVVFVERSMKEGENISSIDFSLSGKEAENAFLDRVIPYPEKGKAIAVYIKYGVMKVKRAAPGGEGWVVDHFDRKAVANYLKHIEDAFERTHTPYPHTFFNDSYEVAEATWTPSLFEEFEKRRGYKLEEHLPQFIAGDAAVISDYRETLSDLLLENFTQQWTAWAHSHGAITRNQAHGSPANLIDCYAAVDIPEIEGFGLSDFNIKGLRQDPGKTRKNDSDFSMLKYASSAAHVCGKPYTSSETFTWLTEHFRTSLSQLKPDMDLMFCAGVNHMFFHGTCYSPKDDEWPGWKFYASIDMSPTNSIWRDAPYFMKYVERCQSFLQWGEPDNDFLVYLPIRDMWKKNLEKPLMQFSIHQMAKLAPEFIQSILAIDSAGFDCDYISERLLLETTCKGNAIVTAAGTRYKGLVIPGSGEMPKKVRDHIEQLKAQGANVIYGTQAEALAKAAKPERMRTECRLKTIRRKNETGYHYFIANLSPQDVCQEVELAVPFEDATWFNPMNGDICQAAFHDNRVSISLRSGESRILQVRGDGLTPNPYPKGEGNFKGRQGDGKAIRIEGPWTLSFSEEEPKVEKSYQLEKLQTWETLDEQTKVTMGTGIYTTHFTLGEKDCLPELTTLHLGDVRESARVYINGQFIGCAWAVPYVLETKGTLRKGDNEIRIEVTNLPANRISELDRKGVRWRKMEEINVVDINYKKTTYADWEPVPSGLYGPVIISNK